MDSSSLIAMEKYYLRNHFVTFWSNFEGLISNNQVKSPDEVFDEVERKDDDLFVWMKKHRDMIISYPTSFSSEKVAEMVKTFPKMCRVNAPKTKADPYVIACAINIRDGGQRTFDLLNPVVVTEEIPASKNNEQKIPDACKFYNIEWISVPTIIKENDWFF